MSFNPDPNAELYINGERYNIAEHATVNDMIFKREGQKGTVYHLLASDHTADQALKVFKPGFRQPFLVSQAEILSAFAHLPGLQAAQRSVLTPSHYANLLRLYPDLIYAVLMPWLDGPTWSEILHKKKALPVEQTLTLARALAEALMGMQEHGLAHCNLSGANVLLTTPAAGAGIALLGLEDFYAPGLLQPQAPSSSPAGYTHQKAAGPFWGPNADRFAGAVLLAEMLGWYDQPGCQAAWGESYFAPDEIHQDSSRYQALVASLRRQWGDGVVTLFARAWHSATLADCPTFGEWLIVLPVGKIQEKSIQDRYIESQLAEHPALSIEPVRPETSRSGMLASAQEHSLHDQQPRRYPEVAVEEKLPLDTGKTETVTSQLPAEAEELAEKPAILSRQNSLEHPKRKLPAWAVIGIGLAAIAGMVGASYAFGILPKFVIPSAVSQSVPTNTRKAVVPVVLPSATARPSPTLVPTNTPLPTETPILTPTQIPTDAILLEQNFEGRSLTGWGDYGGTWVIKEDATGNRYWSGSGPNNYPQVWYGNKSLNWTDYAFESRIMFVTGGTIFICLRSDSGAAFYTVFFDGYNVNYAQYNPSKNVAWTASSQLPEHLLNNVWYLIRLEIRGNSLTAYVNNSLVLSRELPTPLINTQGGIGYYMGGGQEFGIDDIKVWSLK